jgi:hypothetical protein
MVKPRFANVTIDIYGDRMRPLVDVRSPQRTVEHDLIGRDPEVQSLGAGVTDVQIRGECAEQTAKALDSVGEEGQIEYRTHRRSGTAAVADIETNPMKKWYDGVRVYQYTITLLE